jgi:hypothetical protein
MQHRMVDRVRKSQMSSQMMQAAARGALAVDSGEMMEILVHLALHNKVFSEQARMTLAGWDEKASIEVASNASTSAEVLGYLVSPKNLRAALLPALLRNPSVDQATLLEVAATGARWVVEAMLVDEAVKKSPVLLDALRTNPRLRANELSSIDAPAESEPAQAQTNQAAPTATLDPAAGSATVPEPLLISESSEPAQNEESIADPVVEQAITTFLQQNQSELSSSPDKPFEAVVVQEGTGIEGGSPPVAATAALSPSPAVAKAALKPAPGAIPERRDSTLQKISKLDIKGRIALAMRGNKEERSILIRDSTKLVALAVLDSPKVSEGEVEKFALQKNVLQAVLRAIPIKRQFMKNYSIVRNLVFNPRTPLDLSLSLMKNLLINDLRNLSGNKEVSDTVRKLALRMFKQKSEKGKDN